MSWMERLHSIENDLPLVMGILNVTPDSFSDGGRFQSLDTMRQQVEQMAEAGVDIVDIGGESTRPGAEAVALEVELERVLPAIELVAGEFGLPVSIDTYKTQVMKEAVKAGAVLVNDVNALLAEGAEQFVAESGVSVCLMHRQGTSDRMQEAPTYQDVYQEVTDYLLDRAKSCLDAGIRKQNILLDPGFGFGKTLQHNVELFEQLDQMTLLGYPVLVGVSRKRMIGEILGGLPVDQRQIGSVSAAILAALKGARVIRVHDVPETVQALKVMHTLL